MSKILSFVQTKGGTGKTNLARSISFSKIIKKKFPSICLVDMDEQGSLKSWWSEREQSGYKSPGVSFLHMISSDINLIKNQLNSLIDNYDLIILDVAGESVGRLHTKLACAIADLSIIPMRTSTDDESAFEQNLLPIIREIIKKTPSQKKSYQILPTFVHPRTNKAKIADYISSIVPPYIGCFHDFVPYRSVFENYSRDGASLYDYQSMVKNNSRDLKQIKVAISDMDKIATQILKCLDA